MNGTPFGRGASLPPSSGVSEDEAIALYRLMLLIRAFEEGVRKRYWDLQIRGEMHLCIGQEAVAAGVCLPLGPEDAVLSTHRCHGHAIAKGLDLKALAAEIFGRSTGVCGGRGGHMHITDGEKNFMATGIVGAGLPIALGFALASKLEESRKVAVAFFGDGAANQGSFHEALNLAAVWDLPVVFVCENNQLAMSTLASESTAGASIASRAAAYGIPGHHVDGNDAVEVYRVAKDAIEGARRGKGPGLIEALTYRLAPHLELVDLEDYLAEGVKEEWSDEDPIPRMEAVLGDMGVPVDFTGVRADSDKQVEEALEFAANSPTPDPSEVALHVFR